MTACRMLIACWIPRDTNTHSEYVILIVLPLQQWLREHASILCYKYIACLVIQVRWAQVKESFSRTYFIRLCQRFGVRLG